MRLRHPDKTPGLLLVVLALFFAQNVVYAVVVSTTTGNTARPDDDPGWINTVNVRGSTGIYLGNRWVLTAAHVNAGNVAIDGDVFTPVPGSRIQLSNPRGMGLTQLADIVMFQINGDPLLPPLEISTATPKPGTEIIMIGRGKDREEIGTFWEVTEKVPDPIWEKTDSETEYFGYSTLNTNSFRWGTNLIESDDLFERRLDVNNFLTLKGTTFDTLSFVTEFDSTEDFFTDETIKGSDGLTVTDYESQAAKNDSGGPVFFREAGRWVAGGMVLAVSGFENQPDVDLNILFGNLTFAADLSLYRDEILQHYIRGDFDDDGLLTVNDIDLLTKASIGGLDPAPFDLNRDSQVDKTDREIWIRSIRESYFGDSNLDGKFDSSDLVRVFEFAEYEDDIQNNSTWSTGDWNGDGEFSSADFVIALQSGGFADIQRKPAIVPEPNALNVAWLMFSFFAIRTIRLDKPRSPKKSD